MRKESACWQSTCSGGRGFRRPVPERRRLSDRRRSRRVQARLRSVREHPGAQDAGRRGNIRKLPAYGSIILPACRRHDPYRPALSRRARPRAPFRARRRKVPRLPAHLVGGDQEGGGRTRHPALRAQRDRSQDHRDRAAHRRPGGKSADGSEPDPGDRRRRQGPAGRAAASRRDLHHRPLPAAAADSAGAPARAENAPDHPGELHHEARRGAQARRARRHHHQPAVRRGRGGGAAGLR